MRVIFISDSRLCGVERMSLGSSCSVVDKINYYCVPSLVNLLIFSDYPFIYICQFSFSSIINIFQDIIHSYAQEYNNAVVSAQFLKPFTINVLLHSIQLTRDHQTSYENFVCRINEEFINMFNNDETEVHIPLHRALRVRRGGRYLQYSNPQPLKLALYPTEIKKYIVVPQHNR
jgi:hypothetical protein